MNDYQRQIQRCKDQQRAIDRLIDGHKRQIREAERTIQNYRRIPGSDRDIQRLKDQQRTLQRDIDRHVQDRRSLDRQINEIRQMQRRARR